jgi:hypothetical protein
MTKARSVSTPGDGLEPATLLGKSLGMTTAASEVPNGAGFLMPVDSLGS